MSPRTTEILQPPWATQCFTTVNEFISFYLMIEESDDPMRSLPTLPVLWFYLTRMSITAICAYCHCFFCCVILNQKKNCTLFHLTLHGPTHITRQGEEDIFWPSELLFAGCLKLNYTVYSPSTRIMAEFSGCYWCITLVFRYRISHATGLPLWGLTSLHLCGRNTLDFSHLWEIWGTSDTHSLVLFP